MHSAATAAELLAHAIVVGDEGVARWMDDLTQQRLADDTWRTSNWKGLLLPRLSTGT